MTVIKELNVIKIIFDAWRKPIIFVMFMAIILNLLVSFNSIAAEKDTSKLILSHLQMINIPAGHFIMGSNKGEEDEKPAHKVYVPAFKITKNEITFELYDLFVKQTGYKQPNDEGWGRGRRPVINVSWYDTKNFIIWLNKVLQPTTPFRLPTEAEWEYAARAGTETKYWWGDNVGENNANCDNCDSQCDDKQTAPINSFAENPFGLNDTLGNVYEWVQDCWNDNYNGAPEDGSARLSGNCQRRVLRGGSWRDCPRSMRATYRNYLFADQYYNEAGFRLAQSI